MGLLGANYLVQTSRLGYAGLGIYSAVTGDRGGFFTGGLAMGSDLFLFYPFTLRPAIFVGGGGGGAAPQGGGLMLRASADIIYNRKDWQTGIGWSDVRFPNGDINSKQINLSFAYRFEDWMAVGWPKGKGQISSLSLPAQSQQRELYLQSETYWPQRGQSGRSHTPLDGRMDLIGIRWRQQLNTRWKGEFQTDGAWGGNTDGFAQVLLGASYRIVGSSSVDWYLGAMLGAAGGGDVDTGGGLISRGFSGISLNILNKLNIHGELGYTDAMAGQFSATTISLGLGWNYESLVPASSVDLSYRGSDFNWSKWRLRFGSQRYLGTQDEDRKGDEFVGEPVDLAVLKLDAFINNSLYVTGQALGAYEGGAGGYAVGLVGAGLRSPLYRKVIELEVGAEATLGAAGGGGIAVGGGRIFQAMVNFGLQTRYAWGLELSVGQVNSMDGGLSERVVDMNIQYRFSTPHTSSS